MNVYLSISICSSGATWSSRDGQIARKLNGELISLKPQAGIIDESEHEWDLDVGFVENLRSQCEGRISRNTDAGVVHFPEGAVSFSTVTVDRRGNVLLSGEDRTYGSSLRFLREATPAQMGERALHWSRLGFSHETHKSIVDTLLLDWAEYDKERNELRRAKGYLFPTKDEAKAIEHFQGGLSFEAFNHPSLVSYINNCSVIDGRILAWGYIGNSSRLPHLDRALETYLREVLRWNTEQIAVWLTSSNGRHFADEYDGAEFLVKWGFADYTDESAPRMNVIKKDQPATIQHFQGIIDASAPVIDVVKVRELSGFVNWRSGDTPPEHYQGGFSNALWEQIDAHVFDEHGKKMSNHWTHPSRTFENDRVAEFILTRVLNLSPAAITEYLGSAASAQPVAVLSDAFSWLVYPSWPEGNSQTADASLSHTSA
jgi:hypothetical protein